MPIDSPSLEAALAAARQQLLTERTPAGHWVGQLSSSALSTATAAWALHLIDRTLGTDRFTPLIRRAVQWLAANQNEDGGWGDTPDSKSNISTTLLAWSALGASPDGTRELEGAWTGARLFCLGARRAGNLNPYSLATAVHLRYGDDRTFSAPILTMCALAGRLGPETTAWHLVPALPFELAALPHRFLKWLRLPVVSYALPALIAIGQVRFHFRPPYDPLAWTMRAAVRQRTLDLLERVQPASGGFLEAAPLTSFVAMSLAAIDLADHPVTREGRGIPAGHRPAGWQLAHRHEPRHVGHLALGGRPGRGPAGGRPPGRPPVAPRPAVPHGAPVHARRARRLGMDGPVGRRARRRRHGRRPGGPAVARPGRRAGSPGRSLRRRWLLGLQNRDGGIPTFCRGWGRLPFDRSGADLTAHALAAWAAWRGDLPPDLQRRIAAASRRAMKFLKKAQTPGGAWVPLWFGNQWVARETNPTYGTARVISALDPLVRAGDSAAASLAARGAAWLVETQGWDGGWGGARRPPPPSRRPPWPSTPWPGSSRAGTAARTSRGRPLSRPWPAAPTGS